MTCRGTCKPHTWTLDADGLFPLLRCTRCGRALGVLEIEPWRLATIIRSVWRRHGRQAGDNLNRAIAEAQRRAA